MEEVSTVNCGTLEGVCGGCPQPSTSHSTTPFAHGEVWNPCDPACGAYGSQLQEFQNASALRRPCRSFPVELRPATQFRRRPDSGWCGARSRLADPARR